MKTIRSMVLVCSDPRNIQQDAQQVFERMHGEVTRFGLEDKVAIRMVGDMGGHTAGPMVIIYPEAVVYGPVKADDVPYLVEEHLYKGQVAAGLQVAPDGLPESLAWLPSRKGSLPAEQRIVLERAGLINPEDIEDYIIHDGYQALGKVLTSMTPADVIAEISKSGLKGRGGAGFPTGVKWGFVSKVQSDKKYVICNADESEPGTFKDRLVLEGDPHSIIEAIALAAYAVGADEGYIYIRGEYRLAQQRLKLAIQQAREKGFLGEHIFGTDFSFDIHIHSGAGAYVCGEETALIECIEGKRGEPRSRPPYPTTSGLWGKPTLVNNVETLANIPPILRNGAVWYRQFGAPNSPGTKVYTVLGNVNVTGLIEVPMGITLREVIAIYGQGMKGGSAFKLAQTGGSNGSIIPASLQDTPMDFDSYSRVGVALGSGALLICNEDTCVVDLVRTMVNFFRVESCGKCNPCRNGSRILMETLEGIVSGEGQTKDLEILRRASETMTRSSLCGLGQTASIPVTTSLRYFLAEYERHIEDKVCPAGGCPELAEQSFAEGIEVVQ